MEEAFALLAETASGWGIELTAHRRATIAEYVGAVLEHNKTVNLTAETDGSAVLLRHIADGFAAVPLLKERIRSSRPRVCDVGSGAGFIGMAVKIAWPEAEVTMMEALDRKFKFLNLAAARSGLKGLRVLKKKAGRDALPAAQSGYDGVLARALAPLPAAVETCLPLVNPGGVFIAYQSEPGGQDEKFLAEVSATLVKSYPYRLPTEDEDRYLAVFSHRQ